MRVWFILNLLIIHINYYKGPNHPTKLLFPTFNDMFYFLNSTNLVINQLVHIKNSHIPNVWKMKVKAGKVTMYQDEDSTQNQFLNRWQMPKIWHREIYQFQQFMVPNLQMTQAWIFGLGNIFFGMSRFLWDSSKNLQWTFGESPVNLQIIYRGSLESQFIWLLKFN